MCVLINTYQQALSSEIYFLPATVFDFKFQCTQHSHNTMFLDFDPFTFIASPVLDGSSRVCRTADILK